MYLLLIAAWDVGCKELLLPFHVIVPTIANTMSSCSLWSHVTDSAKHYNNKLQTTPLRLAVKVSLLCDTDSVLHDSTCASALLLCRWDSGVWRSTLRT